MKKDAIPRHIGVIPDHNRTWWKKWRWLTGMSLAQVYMRGAARAVDLARWADVAGVKSVTFFGLSCENKKERPNEELDALIEAALYFCEQTEQLGFHVCPFGELDAFRGEERYERLYAELDRLRKKKWPEDGRLIVYMAVNYSGLPQHELPPFVEALRCRGFPEVGEDPTYMRYLLSGGEHPVPPFDLVIRTGNVHRLSGFLPFQSAYAELYFAWAPWPRFTERKFRRTLRWFARQKRNFGK